jgi:hypothetical protein
LLRRLQKMVVDFGRPEALISQSRAALAELEKG